MTSITEIFDEIDIHLQEDAEPSNYLNSLTKEQLKEYPLDYLYKLKATEQSPIHHPEGSVWNHTLLVVDAAASVKDKSKNQRVFMWAALLHDIGKPDTTRNRKGKITSYDHDKVGAEKAQEFLSIFVDDLDFIKEVSSLVRWHMQVLFVMNNLPFADIEGMKRDVDISEIALLGFCDRLGRLNVDRSKEENNMKIFISKLKNQKQ